MIELKLILLYKWKGKSSSFVERAVTVNLMCFLFLRSYILSRCVSASLIRSYAHRAYNRSYYPLPGYGSSVTKAKISIPAKLNMLGTSLSAPAGISTDARYSLVTAL